MEAARHMAYAGGWKKLEPFWNFVIRARRVRSLRPVLEAVLLGFGRHRLARSGRLRVSPGGGPALVSGPIVPSTDDERDEESLVLTPCAGLPSD
jgi:hypothetical protein